jgi:hypothetical protein
MSKFGVKCGYERVAPRPPALSDRTQCGAEAVEFYRGNPIGGGIGIESGDTIIVSGANDPVNNGTYIITSELVYARCERHKIVDKTTIHKIPEEEYLVVEIMGS